ncbi:hypothetical protein BGX21_010970 [Mortierella sp. AD011]|nr:hypothetical protein BGX21_010970 [Mortierella sp. AD011]
MEEYPTATQRTSRERGGSRYDQSNGGNGSFNSPLPPSLTPAGVHSSGPSSGASSPRTRELSSVSTSSYAHSQRYQYQHQHHQHQHQHQHQNRRDSFPTNQYERSYHSPSLEVGDWKNGTSSSRATEFAPHQHQHRHHHHHQQQQQQQQQSLSLRSSHSFDSLPRPVPVKPATFATPSAVSSSAAAASSSSGPSTSGPSDNTISTTTSVTAVTTTTETNDKNDTHGTDPNRKRRGNLPKTVTSVLKSWLVQNAIHPYPTEEEKMRLSEATQLSMNQISNWFINARRRILQPILVEAAAAAVAGTDAPMDNVLIVRKGCKSKWNVVALLHRAKTKAKTKTKTKVKVRARVRVRVKIRIRVKSQEQKTHQHDDDQKSATLLLEWTNSHESVMFDNKIDSFIPQIHTHTHTIFDIH